MRKCVGGLSVVREVEVVGNLVPDDLDTLAGEEANLEAPLAPPPDGVLRGRHVNNRDHVPNLQWDTSVVVTQLWRCIMMKGAIQYKFVRTIEGKFFL